MEKLRDLPSSSQNWNENSNPRVDFKTILSSALFLVAQSCPTLWDPPGQNTGVGRLSLLQGLFHTQGLNPGLPHCKQILYQLSHREAQEYWHGSLSFLQWIFLTQESKQGLLHCRQILYQLSYQGSPNMVQGWINILF